MPTPNESNTPRFELTEAELDKQLQCFELHFTYYGNGLRRHIQTLQTELAAETEKLHDALTHERDAQRGAKINAEVVRLSSIRNADLLSRLTELEKVAGDMINNINLCSGSCYLPASIKRYKAKYGI